MKQKRSFVDNPEKNNKVKLMKKSEIIYSNKNIVSKKYGKGEEPNRKYSCSESYIKCTDIKVKEKGSK